MIRLAKILAVWAIVVGWPYAAFGPLWGSIWLAVGYGCDWLCLREATKRSEAYEAPIQVAAYVVGPAFFPFALAAAAFKAFLHFVRHI